VDGESRQVVLSSSRPGLWRIRLGFRKLGRIWVGFPRKLMLRAIRRGSGGGGKGGSEGFVV